MILEVLEAPLVGLRVPVRPPLLDGATLEDVFPTRNIDGAGGGGRARKGGGRKGCHVAEKALQGNQK